MSLDNLQGLQGKEKKMSSCWDNTLHPHKWLWWCEGGTGIEGNPTFEFHGVKMKHF